MRRGIATFTLDTGHCPPWLWQRMVKLGREMVEMLVLELGPDEFIRRVSDPTWFQTLGTVLAFDWNASGLTTILTASLRNPSAAGNASSVYLFAAAKVKLRGRHPTRSMPGRIASVWPTRPRTHWSITPKCRPR